MGGTQPSSTSQVGIHASFPGGNIVVREIAGDDVYLDQDLRDTEGTWFYWYFAVTGAAGKTLRFHFGGEVIGTEGPAVSLDGGDTWSWIKPEDLRTFTYAFPSDAAEVRFAFGIPYVESNLASFLDRFRGQARLEVGTLAQTDKGRAIELIKLHPESPSGEPDPIKILVTCRHHACEAVAGYVVEGLIESALAGETAPWFARHAECLVIPFVDKDGVEDGDQGKNRRPWDHNRDYWEESVHASVRAIREFVPNWSGERLRVALDVHCPNIRGPMNEKIYMVGSSFERIWEEQVRFGRVLEHVQNGRLRYRAEDNLPYGEGWNGPRNYKRGANFSKWAAGLPGVRLATGIEFPYATSRGQVIDVAGARAFGRDLARALQHYLGSTD